jgi:hypothetical protein
MYNYFDNYVAVETFARIVAESSCNSGNGTGQRVQSLMFMMMIMETYARVGRLPKCTEFVGVIF